MLTHIVLMKLHDVADAAKAKELLEGLADRVPEVLSLAVGINVRQTDFSYDLALTTTHDDLAGLQAYQDHEAHQEVISWLGQRLAGRAIVDYA